jgi:two-component system response regulator
LSPAIVLLDINMPRLSGLDVLRRLRAESRTKSLPVIMLTTSGHDADVAASYALGANSFVRKPVNSDDFLTAAQALGTYWLNINQHAEPEL